MPKIDLAKAPVKTGSIYPAPYADLMAGRSSLRLGDMGGLTQFGVNLVTLAPGALASLRHWHLKEDEFAIVLEGDLTLIEDGGETTMQPGDCAAWKAGVANGHHFVNRSDRPARFLVIGSKIADEIASYSDVDMKIHMNAGKPRFTYRDDTEWMGPR